MAFCLISDVPHPERRLAKQKSIKGLRSRFDFRNNALFVMKSRVGAERDISELDPSWIKVDRTPERIKARCGPWATDEST